MLLKAVALCMVLLSSACGLSVPRQTKSINLDHPHGLARRNDTAAMTGELVLNVDPDLPQPTCGGIYDAQINVKQAPDPFYLSAACANILSYIGGNKGKKDVNVLFECPGGSPTGSGDRAIRFIIDLLSPAGIDGLNPGTQLVPCTLQVVNPNDNTFISAAVNLGVKMSGMNATLQFIYC
ncbi:hypothetical protein H2200_012856 [Cladophialophora chaetospira]|uniref:Uncharacterized protein n=1 Tax=Cladophialophora chaetospira TaxID=386627 RepID=A0AA39CBY8_9EURO|nr:hypothetical protein H2200_012856 [Cladophialophora chaetospira]